MKQREKIKTYLTATTVVLLTLFAFANTSKAALNNASIISDYNFSNSNPMSAADINTFLSAKGSGLANYVIPEYIDVPYPLAAGGFGTVSSRQINDLNGIPFYGKTVAQLIYDESVEHNVNPRVVLATLEKESSAITGNVFRSSTVATWPMFYMYDETMAGCLNSGINCNDSAYRQTSLDFGGIGRQLGYSIAWFGTKYSQYKTTGRPLKNGSGQIVGYEQYSDPVSIDGNLISCQTAGSRILYLYTPHIQTSFYNIFSNFFDDPASGAPPAIIMDNAEYRLRTYSDATVKVTGTKLTTVQAYLDDALIADFDATTWEVSLTPAMGSTRAVIYRFASGAEATRKILIQERHKLCDINGDTSIDITDLAILAENWNKTNSSEPLADMNGDLVVDITDLAILAENWGR